jgi:hypothetical protein
MQIPSGATDRLIFFVAVDATDLKTRETGLTTFTVYRSRNGGAATVYTTPTVAEVSTANMPGVYSLVLDEDTTLTSGHDTEEYCVHITQASMAPVTRVVELYRPKFTEGQTAAMASNAVSTVTTVTTVDGLAANVITATAIASGAFTAAKFAAGAFDAVWTVTTRELTAFSTALALSVWHVLEASIVTASTIGLKVKTNLDAAISSRSTYAGADTAGTTTLLARIIGTLATGTHNPQSGDAYARLGAPAGASVSADLAAIEAQTDDIGAAGAGLTAVPWNAAWDAEVNAEVVDALATDTYAEPGQGAPGATISLAAKLNYLYKSWRNRATQSASQYALYGDDATTIHQKAPVSEAGGTMETGEIVTGP